MMNVLSLMKAGENLVKQGQELMKAGENLVKQGQELIEEAKKENWHNIDIAIQEAQKSGKESTTTFYVPKSEWLTIDIEEYLTENGCFYKYVSAPLDSADLVICKAVLLD